VQLISAIVEPSKVDEICEALQAFGFRGLTVIEVAGFGKRRGRLEVYRGAEYRPGFRKKAKLELVVRDEEVADMMDVICQVASTGNSHADTGKIWVVPVSTVMRMSTKETGVDAL
jgi:nitrogen regulatory protein P-II 1